MNKSFSFLLGLLLALVSVSCTDSSFNKRVEADFQKKQECFSSGDFFKVFQRNDLSSDEREALTFLYAYMPVGDITDYDGDFYLENVRSAYSTRKETTWGKTMPEDVFRHFVLPIRVNNENLDRSRMVFHDELIDRIKNLSMYDAVLEVNHWCHEKANYQPSDSRTSSPLATVRTAYGRCGEESTFLVAALRSVGIPARQVYTPRWAHTDDNHAWVEAWVDGKWYFLGACEPEPVLNLGWFNAPASRGMLMHTKVFGYYEGPEEVMRTSANYTEINVISNYADNASVEVTAVDEAGKPVQGANVRFGIYNYAEFYTVSTQNTAEDGKARLSAGLGDMVVVATKDDHFGISRVSFGKDKDVKIALSHKVGEEFSFPVDIVPPAEKPNTPEVTPEQRAENDRRFNIEDSIRHAYIATFPQADAIKAFAGKNGYDEKKVERYIVASRGNYQSLFDFLQKAAEKNMKERALQLLETLAEKDYRDIPVEVLDDHLYNTATDADVEWILAPRVSNEMLTPYRSYFQKEVAQADAEAFRADPQKLVEWCRTNLTMRDELCTVGTTISPIGVWKSRICDSRSLNIFFVSIARSLNIPARIDHVTGTVLYKKGNDEVVADFKSGTSESVVTGKLKLDYVALPRLDDPEYFRHFSLSMFNQSKGSFDLLGYSDFEKWSALFKNPSSLPVGYYMMVTGSRMADGSVLANVSFFNINKDELTETQLVMRDNAEKISVIGSFNSESIYTNVESGQDVSVLSTTGRGYFCIAVLGVNQEPTNHALKDVAQKAAELEKWGRKMVFLFTDADAYAKYQKSPIAGLPSNVVFGIDRDGSIRNQILTAMKLAPNTQLPLFIIADTFNRVVFEQHGYTIGMGDQLLKTIHGL